MGTTAEKLQAVLNSKNAVKAALEELGFAVTDDFSTYADFIKVLGIDLGVPIVTTAGDGAAYTAELQNVDELEVGMQLVVIPHVTSTTKTATLNLNGLGAKQFRQRLSTNTSITVAAQNDSWLVSGKPITVTYNGTFWVAELTRPDANTIYGTIKIENGGTGASTPAGALSNLGLTASAEELNYMDGVTSNVQTQIDSKVQANRVSQINWSADGWPQFYVDNSSWIELARRDNPELRYNAVKNDIFSTSLGATHDCWNKWACAIGAGDIDNSPEPNTNGEWWEVLTCGVDSRAVQIAWGCYNFTRKMFIRYKHDGNWSGWKKVLTSDDFTVSNGVLTLNFL